MTYGPVGSKTHPQGVSNNSHPEPYQPSSLYSCLTPWLMEPGGSMPNSQGLPNNPYPEPNQTNPFY